MNLGNAFQSCLCIFISAGTVWSAGGQSPSSPQPEKHLDAVLTMVLSGQPGFRARMQIKHEEDISSKRVSTSSEADFVYLEGKTWTRLGATTVSRVGPDGRTNRMSMDASMTSGLITIVRTDKKIRYEIIENRRAYVEKPMGQWKIQLAKTASGRETIDSHECVKRSGIATEKSAGKFKLTLWCAPDLNNLPIKIEIAGGGQTGAFAFRYLQFAEPEASFFDPPAGFTKYADMRQVWGRDFPGKDQAGKSRGDL